MDLFDIRKDYRKGHLSPEGLNDNPLIQLEQWIGEAEQAQCLEHSAVVLSSASASGAPSSRVVLLKKIDHEGLYIFTNYNSRKGQQLAENNHGALLFFWPELERQVNIEGLVEKTSRSMSESYFEQRPLASRVSACVSKQSEEVASRETMEQAWTTALAQAQGENIQCPDYWGGYLLRPTRIEFWQGGANRFHDRILFEKSAKSWTRKRLMP